MGEFKIDLKDLRELGLVHLNQTAMEYLAKVSPRRVETSVGSGLYIYHFNLNCAGIDEDDVYTVEEFVQLVEKGHVFLALKQHGDGVFFDYLWTDAEINEIVNKPRNESKSATARQIDLE